MKYFLNALFVSFVAFVGATGCQTVKEGPSSDNPVELAPASAVPKAPERKDGRVILGYVEYIQIYPENLKIPARLDSGATTSSLNAIDLVHFERDGENWVRFKTYDPAKQDYIEFERKVVRTARIRRHEGEATQTRPVVRLEISLAGIRQEKEFTLIDRSNFDYQALIGRNVLSDVVLVDSAEKFLGGEPAAE